ncbi:MAG: carboxypeptidase-like regulatory domain-containing protein [bacterium]
MTLALRWWFSSMLGVLMLLLPALLAAQPPAESGLARDAKLRTPLECLHVALVDADDRAVAHTVTDAQGTFVLVAPAPGVYRVRFEIFGWETLVGPPDTLAAGALREREYPLDFTSALRSDGVAPAAFIEALRRREGSAFQSAAALAPDGPIRYPVRMAAAGTNGGAVAQYIVSERGTVRSESWRPITFTHDDFLGALRAFVPAMRYRPARLDGQPVCQLIRNNASFQIAHAVPFITLFN